MTDHVFLPIDPALIRFVDAALVRLRYLHSDLAWSIDLEMQRVAIAGDVNQRVAALQKDLNYQIYREKILEETASIRRRLYEAL